MTKELEITIDTSALDDLYGQAPLFEYSSDGESYRAYLLLDEEGNVYVDTRAPWDNASPIEEWFGRTLKWEIPAAARGKDLRDAVRGERFLDLMQCVYDGHSIKWNGNNNVGVLDDDANEASDELDQLLGDLPVWDVWNAGDFMQPVHIDDNLWPAGKSLRVVVADLKTEASDQDVFIAGGTAAIIGAMGEKLLQQFEDDDSFELTSEQRQALLNHDASALANIEAARAE